MNKTHLFSFNGQFEEFMIPFEITDLEQAWEAISSGYSSNHDLYGLFKLC